MKKLLMIGAIALLMVACNKNQKAVKKLDGNWTATSLVTSDGEESFDLIAFGISYKMAFDACKLKNDEYCDVTLTVSAFGSVETTTELYRVTNDGETFEVKTTGVDGEPDYTESFDIEELTKTDLTLVQTSDGETTTIKLEKD